MTTYAPSGFGVTSVIGPHQGLRVTFAQTRSGLTPDFVEAADFRDNIAHLAESMATGGYQIAPASDVVVAPGELAATIDFAVVGQGSLTVAQAVTQIQGALYGALDFARRTYLRKVELIGVGGVPWGSSIPDPGDDHERSLIGTAAALGGLALLIGGAIYFGPELKLAARGALRARGAR